MSAAAGFFLALQQESDEARSSIELSTDGAGRVARLSPADARSLAAHLLHHSNVADGLCAASDA